MKTYQVNSSDHSIIGGASPNDFISVDKFTKDQIFEQLKECNKYRHGPMETEVKVVFVYFQNTPKEMPPFSTLADHQKTTN